MTPTDARLHVDARPADRTVRLTVSADTHPGVRLDLDPAAVRELAAQLLDAAGVIDPPREG